MIRQILVAVDTSQSSAAAMRFTADCAGALSARVRAVFVEEEQRYLTYLAMAASPGAAGIPVRLDPERVAAEKRQVEAERVAIETSFRQTVAKQVPGAVFESIAGATESVLVEAARLADLVIMGKRGQFEAGPSKAAGPTTEALIHDSLRPVVVVPAQARSGGPILIAFDDSKGVQRVLPAAVELAERLECEVVALTVDEKVDRGRKIQEPLKAYLQGRGIEAKFLVAQGNPAEAVLRVAEEERAKLVAMGAFGQNPVYQLFFGSTARSVLERAKCPVLLMA